VTPRFRNRLVWPALIAVFLLGLSYCRFNTEAVAGAPEGYWAQVDTVSYVGMETCASCHPDHHDTYQHTGMGRSFGLATRDRSDADYSGHPQVYDKALDLYYRPFWAGDSLKIAEFRLDGKDTIHYLVQTISYVIGSGQHTNSHLINRGGYLFQAPITFYTQEKRWDLAPGFSDGHNSRFSRLIETECMTCHNGLPQPLAGSLNGYEAVPTGIDCERCHGPGAEHVRQKLAGILVDTANDIDYTIVHPGKLPLDAQLDLCQRCHLQGVTVLNEGSDWFDFRPGDRISDHWNIFLPDFAGGNGGFLMASQAERLRRSACFVATGGISCITCHNPHQSVRETPRAVFNQPCKDCHGGGSACKATLAVRQAGADDCSRCHMPRSGSVDIPHVTITDHKVSIPGRAQTGQGAFSGLECLTDDQPDAMTMARGYLRFFEAFSTDPAMLDSAARYLDQAARESPDPGFLQRTRLHLLYLQKNHAAGAALAATTTPGDWQDAWSCYRAGECFSSVGNIGQSLPWLARAVELLPRHPDFRLKYANALAALGQNEAATREYTEVLKQEPNAAQAWSNLGFLELQRGEGSSGERRLREAARLDPDYLPARLHLAQWYRASGRELESAIVVKQLLKRHAGDPSVQALAERWQIR